MIVCPACRCDLDVVEDMAIGIDGGRLRCLCGADLALVRTLAGEVVASFAVPPPERRGGAKRRR